jgi:multiple sugar transport system ATP-binding protein
MAYVECGMPAVPVPEPPDRRVVASGLGGSRGGLSGLVRRLFPPREEETQAQEQVGQHPGSGGHRRADLIVRLGNRPAWRAGDAAKVAVDHTRLMIFTTEGARIDKPQR